MVPPLTPSDELERLEALRQYQLLERSSDQALDDLTDLSALICQVPIALVSIVGEGQQWFKSCHGLSIQETTREVSFCAHAIHEDELLIIPDASRDLRFRDNPLVTGHPHIQFYAGVVLRTPQGHALGTLCVIDHHPRKLSSEQIKALKTLAAQVMNRLEMRKLSRLAAENGRFLQGILDSDTMGVTLLSPEQKILRTNAAALRIIEADSHDQAVGLFTNDLVLPEFLPQISVFTKSILQGESGRIEFQIRGLKGTLKWLQTHASPQRDESGNIIGLLGLTRDITRDRQLETDRQESEAKYRTLFDNAPEGIAITNHEGNYIAANSRFLKLLGYESKDLGNLSAAEVTAPRDRHRIEPAIEQLVATGSFRERWACLHRDGSEIETDVVAAIMPDNTLMSIVRDITDQMTADRALQESEEKFHSLVDFSIEGIILFIEDQPTYVNPALCQISGYSPEEILSKSIQEQYANVHPEDQATALERRRRMNAGNVTEEPTVMRIRHKNGSWRWVKSAGKSFTLGGRPARIGMIIDITEQKEAELRIHQLNRTLTMLSDINQLIVREPRVSSILENSCLIAHKHGKFLLAWIGMVDGTSGRLEVVAHAGADAATLDLLQRLYDDPRQSCVFTQHVLETGKRAVCNDIATDEKAAPWRDEALQRGYRSMVALPITIEDRTLGTFNLYAPTVGFFSVEELNLLDELALDISFAVQVSRHEAERARVEDARRESEERFRQLAENIHEVFWITDPDKRHLLYVSPAYETIWGRPRQDLYEHPETWLESIHPDDRERIAHAITHDQISGEYDETYRITRPDGSIRWIHDRAYPVREADGSVKRLVGTAEDVTKHRLLEEQYRESRKMDAIGQLAGGIAHDFNNILSAILMQAELVGRNPALPSACLELINDLKGSAKRAANLTRQLLAFSRRQVMQPLRLDLNDNITQLSKMLQRLVREDVQVQLDLHPTALPVVADSGMIDQVLLNLAINARDAMPSGGRITIASSRRHLSDQDKTHFPDLAPGDYAALLVSDNGCGISEANLPQIFEPFFTTKEAGSGTGLGLATVYGIVRQHKGAVHVTSEVDRGTTFEILLPLTLQATGNTAAPLEAENSGHGESILLVEDETAVRNVTRMLLEQSGFKVEDASSGPMALELWERHEPPFDLLLTDLVMPGGINGMELARQLRERTPELRVIYTSGYNRDLAGQKIIDQPGTYFLQKPASADLLVQTIRRCLDTPISSPDETT